MRTKSSCQFPYPLYRVEFWTVRWQKIQAEKFPELSQKRIKCSCMMPTSIIQNQDDLLVSSFSMHKDLNESPEIFCVEFLYLKCRQPTIGRPDCTEKSNTLSSRCMQYHRVLFLWRYPHRTPRTMLLKVTFILKPQIHIRTTCQNLEFFYISPVLRGRLSLSTAAVSGVGNQVGEIIVGIVAHQESRRIAFPDESLTASRPTGSAGIQEPVAVSVDLFRYRAVLLYQLQMAYPAAHLRKCPQILFARSGVSNTVPCEGFVQTYQQFHSCFSPNMPGEYHAIDDHNESLRTEESLVEQQFA
jgi:hypothetical protein